MRKALLAVILIVPLFGFLLPVLSPVHGFTAYTLVASTAVNSTDSSTITSTPVDMTGADLIIIGETHYTLGSTIISDSQSNSYTCGTMYSSLASGTARFCYIHNPSVSASQTVTSTCTACYPAFVVEAWKYSSNSPADQSNGDGNITTGGATAQFGSITPTQDNELIVSMLGDQRHSDPTVDSGFNLRYRIQVVSAISFGIAFADKVQTSATAENPTWTYPSDTFFQSSGINMSFKFTAPAATGNRNLMLQGIQ